MLPVIIRNRAITETELKVIQSTVAEHWDKGRTAISKIPCRKWNWLQLNGLLKDMSCREVPLTLGRMNLLRLPPRKNGVRLKKRKPIDNHILSCFYRTCFTVSTPTKFYKFIIQISVSFKILFASLYLWIVLFWKGSV